MLSEAPTSLRAADVRRWVPFPLPEPGRIEGRRDKNMMIESGKDLIQSSRRYKWLLTRQAQFALDLLALALAFVLAYLLRFDFAVPKPEFPRAMLQLPCVMAIQFATLMMAGIYTFIWRYVGMAEIRSFTSAAVWSALVLVAMRLWLPEPLQSLRAPLSVIVIDTMVAFCGILGLRVVRRLLYERFEKRRESRNQLAVERARVLLVGAGRAGVMTVREIAARGESELDVKGFVDDDPNKLGSVIHGVKVLGSTRDLQRLARELDIDQVVISIAQASREEFRRILDICEEVSLKVRVIPALYEILQGRVTVSRIRDLEIEDLLGREPVELDEEEIEDFLNDKTVMVTGAGGSIGSELARQIARVQPSQLLLVERAEFALFNIDRELRQAFPDLSIASLVADVSDVPRMRRIFSTYRPEIIFHAAAHKHVPMMEHNSIEAVKNNVLATRLLGTLAGEYSVKVCVLISTDKAVRPTSVMGATKRIAELIMQDLDRSYETRYVAVRFGNVIGSAGSVIPIFREQIRSGGPVTVTHPDMVRYFMTIPEASQLVLQAGAIGGGGEIFILDMGEPVRILDLAKEAITLSGLRPFEDIDIVFTGIRPGEKLFEELEIKEEQMSKTRHPKIFIGRIAAYPERELRRALERLQFLVRSGNEQELRKFLRDLLPESRIEVGTDIGLVVRRLQSERAAASKMA